MASIKIVLDKRRQKDDGTYPLIIRVSHESKSKTIALNISLKEEQWNGKSQSVTKLHTNYKLFNLNIKRKYVEIEERLLRLDPNENFSVSGLLEKLQNKRRKVSVGNFTMELISQMKQANKIGNAMVYQSTLNRVLKFYSHKELRFTDITYDFLMKYETALTAEGLMGNSVSLYMRTLRIIYNKAIKSGIVDKSAYPFAEIPIKHERTRKRAISKEKIKLIERVQLPEDSPMVDARNYFILSFNLIGISFIDLAMLKEGDLKNGRANYTRKKTGKFYSIELTEKAKLIIEYYSSKRSASNPNSFVLPIIPEEFNGNYPQEHRWAKMRLKYCNKYIKRIGKLCEIEELLTTYVARHSWATIAKRIGYSTDMIAEALGHENENKITSVYLDKFDQEVIDKMNAVVTGDE